MEFWQEFLASSWGKEFFAGGCGGIAGLVFGHPLDTVRIRQQQSTNSSAFRILSQIISVEGPKALYKGMGAPLATITFQNALLFQTYAILSHSFDWSKAAGEPPSYMGVTLGGVGAGALQSLLISPAELIKIRLQLQQKNGNIHKRISHLKGPISTTKSILRKEGVKGMCRGLGITILRDAPSHGVYFWTYEYMKEQFHPDCRKSRQESPSTMLISGGLAGVTSWISCYPLDVLKTRIQAQTSSSPCKYNGIMDCFCRSIKQEGFCVLWQGLGTTLLRAFVVNGAVFSAYEIASRCFFEK